MLLLPDMILWNTACAGCIAVVISLIQRHRWLKSRPGISHLLWCIVLLKLVIPPVFTFSLPTLESKASTKGETAEISLPILLQAASDAAAETVPAPFWASLPWFVTLSAMSILGSALILLVCVARTKKISRIVRQAKPASEPLQKLVVRLADELGVGRSVSVVTIHACTSPFLWVSVRGPSIVIPAALAESLEPRKLQLVIQHELLHYVRRDHWTNVFSFSIGVLLWWNPVAWWARRELRFAQELCCDAMVLSSNSGQRRRYAETLLEAIDFVASDEATFPVPSTAFGGCSTFKRRVEMVSNKSLSSQVPVLSRWLILPCAALVIATAPAFGHDDEDSSDRLRKMSNEIRELRAAVNDLQSMIRTLTQDRTRPNRNNEWKERRESEMARLSRDRLMQMAERADLNEDERGVLLRLAEQVDMNARQFEQLSKSDDLNETQYRILKKIDRAHEDRDRKDSDRDALYRDRPDHDQSEGRGRRGERILRVTRQQLNQMAERADLNEDERGVLLRLAEQVDMNARQFEQLSKSDDLNETQYRILKKIDGAHEDQDRKDSDRDALYRDRPDHDQPEGRGRRGERILRVTRQQLMQMAERADLNEDERGVLLRLAEQVDMNARQFEQLSKSDDLNETQYRILKKIDRAHKDQDRKNSGDED